MNGIFGDPVVLLRARQGRRALLFDLGTIERLDAATVLRVTHVFVSHAHLDHVAGFDRLLRLRLQHARPVTLVGPPGFIDQVEARLRSFTWNLLGPDSADFSLIVEEHGAPRLGRRSCFRARHRFAPDDASIATTARGFVHAELAFTVTAALLDHGTPCLGFALQERARVTLRVERLASHELSPGPWINRAKAAIQAGDVEAVSIPVGPDLKLDLATLRAELFTETPGQKIVYVTDIADHPANEAAVVDLARDADVLFIEAAFADEDRALASVKRHLTAGAAGRMARLAGAKRLLPMHLSARYADRPEPIRDQVAAAFGGVVVWPGDVASASDSAEQMSDAARLR